MCKADDFNLVDDEWIRARYLTGEVRELSLLELFHDAPNIASLANDLPTQDFAILRMLLAIVERAVMKRLDGDEDPAEVWLGLWQKEQLPLKEIEEYLGEWRERFDLFDDSAPFMQVAGMHTSKNDVAGVSKIIADVPDGYPFFTMRSSSGAESLSFAEAARWVIHAHAFDTAGIKSGVVGDPSVKGGKSYSTGYPGWAGVIGGLFVEDCSLAKTMLANLVLWDSWANRDELLPFDDKPAWERDPGTPGDNYREPRGFADLYTWQSRRILLSQDDGRVTGVVLTNGDKIDPYNRQSLEPMTAWRRSPNQEKKLGISPVYWPIAHKLDKAFWRSLSSVLPLGTANEADIIPPGIVSWIGYLQDRGLYPRDRSVRLHAVGMEYGTQNSVVTEVFDDVLDANSFILSQAGKDANVLIRDVLARTDSAVYAYGSFAVNLRIASGDEDRLGGIRRNAQAEAYYEFDAIFRAWLAGLTPDSDLLEEDRNWNRVARGLLAGKARNMIRQIDSRAITGHKGKAGWMTAAKAESVFYKKLDELMPRVDMEREGGNG